MAHARPPVGIVVLNWNNAADTLVCLSSVFRLEYANTSVVVVDNGSIDESVSRISAAYPELKILRMPDNLGYAEGNNAGTRYLLEQGADYVLLLNNDTVVEPGMLAELVEFAGTHPTAGLIGPAVLCVDPPDRLFSLGGFIDWQAGNTWHRGMFRPATDFLQLRQPEQVDFIAGCGVLVSKALTGAAGLLASDYFLNFEDTEWAARALRRGFESWLVPSAVMRHKVSATLGQDSPINTYYFTRNALRFFWRNSPARRRWLTVGRVAIRTLRTIAAWSVKPAYRDEAYRLRRMANILALRDFFLNRSGRMSREVAALCSSET